MHKPFSNARRPFQMLRLSFEMLKSSSKRPKSAQKEQTMLKTHDRISKCSNCLQKRPKSTQKEQRMFKTHDRTPQCSREHSIPSFEPFPGQKTFGIESKYPILDCQQLVPNQILNRSLLGQNINLESMCHAVLLCTRVT